MNTLSLLTDFVITLWYWTVF